MFLRIFLILNFFVQFSHQINLNSNLALAISQVVEEFFMNRNWALMWKSTDLEQRKLMKFYWKCWRKLKRKSSLIFFNNIKVVESMNLDFNTRLKNYSPQKNMKFLITGSNLNLMNIKEITVPSLTCINQTHVSQFQHFITEAINRRKIQLSTFEFFYWKTL
jgi:hypothetical protein